MGFGSAQTSYNISLSRNIFSKESNKVIVLILFVILHHMIKIHGFNHSKHDTSNFDDAKSGLLSFMKKRYF